MREKPLTQDKIDAAFLYGIRFQESRNVLLNLCRSGVYSEYKNKVVYTIGDTKITLEDISFFKLNELNKLVICKSLNEVLKKGVEEELIALFTLYALKMGFTKNELKTPYNKGVTPFALAIAWGLEKVLEIMLDTGGSELLEMRDKEGNTSLHIAAIKGKTRIIDIILKAGTSKEILKKCNNTGKTALHLAAEEGHVEIVRALLTTDIGLETLKYNDIRGKTPLHLACDKKHVRVVEEILSKKIGQETLQYINTNGNTILHLAVLNGSADIINTILECDKGIETLKYYNIIGKTPLRLAYDMGNEEVINAIEAYTLIGYPQSVKVVSWQNKVSKDTVEGLECQGQGM